MFENRQKGRNLAKIVSYGYLIIGALLIIVTFALNNNEGALALAQRGTSIVVLIFGDVMYFIFAGIIYFLSTKYENDEMLWKFILRLQY